MFVFNSIILNNQKIRNIYWVMTDINLVGFFPKFSHIMKISIILDPCNDFPAFLGNARISFFYGHIQIICFFYLNIFKETLYHQNFNHSWSHFPNVAFQSYSRMLCFILMLFYFFPHIMNILVHCKKTYHYLLGFKIMISKLLSQVLHLQFLKIEHCKI